MTLPNETALALTLWKDTDDGNGLSPQSQWEDTWKKKKVYSSHINYIQWFFLQVDSVLMIASEQQSRGCKSPSFKIHYISCITEIQKIHVILFMYLKIHICKVTFLQFELKSLIEILPFSNREVGQLKIRRHLKQTLPIPNVNAKQRKQI